MELLISYIDGDMDEKKIKMCVSKLAIKYNISREKIIEIIVEYYKEENKNRLVSALKNTPFEIKQRIASGLTPSDMLMLCLVDKEFDKIICKDIDFIKSILKNYFHVDEQIYKKITGLSEAKRLFKILTKAWKFSDEANEELKKGGSGKSKEKDEKIKLRTNMLLVRQNGGVNSLFEYIKYSNKGNELSTKRLINSKVLNTFSKNRTKAHDYEFLSSLPKDGVLSDIGYKRMLIFIFQERNTFIPDNIESVEFINDILKKVRNIDNKMDKRTVFRNKYTRDLLYELVNSVNTAIEIFPDATKYGNEILESIKDFKDKYNSDYNFQL